MAWTEKSLLYVKYIKQRDMKAVWTVAFSEAYGCGVHSCKMNNTCR
jgi:hypothetical protein